LNAVLCPVTLFVSAFPEKKGIEMANPNPIIQTATQFKPGHPGGPGRPRKRPLSEAYDQLLREPLPKEVQIAMKLPANSTWADGIAAARARQALSTRGGGAVFSAREMREATEGKATQRIEVMSPQDQGFRVEVVFEMPQGKPLPAPEEATDAAIEVVGKTIDDVTATAIVEQESSQ
jgi:hypothetical protein